MFGLERFDEGSFGMFSLFRLVWPVFWVASVFSPGGSMFFPRLKLLGAKLFDEILVHH